MSSETNPNKLIVYLSYTGDTKNVGMVEEGNNSILVKSMREYLKADVFHVIDNTKYPHNFPAIYAFATKMKYAKKRPSIKEVLPDLNKYNEIFLVYPIWVQDLPMILYTFLENTYLENKKIIPFCTHEGSGICDTYKKIKEMLVESNVLEHDFSMTGVEARTEEGKNKMIEWLKSLGY